jgi:hypothetical protein
VQWAEDAISCVFLHSRYPGTPRPFQCQKNAFDGVYALPNRGFGPHSPGCPLSQRIYATFCRL